MRFMRTIDFKNYVNDLFNSKFKNIADNAEKELHINKTTNDENIQKQNILEQKIQKLSCYDSCF